MSRHNPLIRKPAPIIGVLNAYGEMSPRFRRVIAVPGRETVY